MDWTTVPSLYCSESFRRRYSQWIMVDCRYFYLQLELHLWSTDYQRRKRPQWSPDLLPKPGAFLKNETPILSHQKSHQLAISNYETFSVSSDKFQNNLFLFFFVNNVYYSSFFPIKIFNKPHRTFHNWTKKFTIIFVSKMRLRIVKFRDWSIVLVTQSPQVPNFSWITLEKQRIN